MKTPSWPHYRQPAHRGKEIGRAARLGRRPRLEALEDRTVPSGTPRLVLDINSAPLSSNPANFAVIGSTTYFASNDGTHGSELWKSDGTAAGTVMVADINPGSAGSGPSNLTSVNGELFFSANDGADGTELWKSDGTAAGTVMVKDLYPGVYTGYNGGAYPNSSSPSNVVNVNGTLFFTANDGVHGSELWRSDGTAAGTVLVTDIWSGSGSSNPSKFANVNGTVFFSAYNGSYGTELWKSDGTAAGTVLVKDINTNSSNASSYPEDLTNVNGTLFFDANDGVHGRELWKSDGTATGTVLVKDVNSGSHGSNTASYPRSLTNVNGTLFFSANDGSHGTELWKSNGTEAGTLMVKDINPGRNHSYPCFLTNVNGTLFFVAQEGVHGRELWKSDGTEAGTVLVKDINPGSASAFPRQHIGNLTAVGKTLFFAADDGVHGEQLWKSDGTKAGTVLVKAIGSGKQGFELARSSYDALAEVNGTIYFAANDGVHGRELWKSDGTEAGTVLVKDIAPGRNDSNLDSLTNVNGTLFFAASDGVHCKKLWKSDGTQAGTVPVKDFFPDSDKPFPLQRIGQLVAVDKTLFFMADRGGNKAGSWGDNGELWHMPIPRRPGE